MPTAKTNKTQILTPEKTTRLFSVQPLGKAKITGTPISRVGRNVTIFSPLRTVRAPFKAYGSSRISEG